MALFAIVLTLTRNNPEYTLRDYTSGDWARKAVADETVASRMVGGFSYNERQLYYLGLRHIANQHQRLGSFTIGQVVSQEKEREQRLAASTPEPTPQPTEAASLTIGATARITDVGSRVGCFPNKDDYEAAYKAAAAHDDYGFAEAMANAIMLANGTQVRGIDAGGFMYSDVKVRVESGDHAGETCWTAQEPRYFKDVQRGG